MEAECDILRTVDILEVLVTFLRTITALQRMTTWFGLLLRICATPKIGPDPSKHCSSPDNIDKAWRRVCGSVAASVPRKWSSCPLQTNWSGPLFDVYGPILVLRKLALRQESFTVLRKNCLTLLYLFCENIRFLGNTYQALQTRPLRRSSCTSGRTSARTRIAPGLAGCTPMSRPPRNTNCRLAARTSGWYQSPRKYQRGFQSRTEALF